MPIFGGDEGLDILKGKEITVWTFMGNTQMYFYTICRWQAIDTNNRDEMNDLFI